MNKLSTVAASDAPPTQFEIFSLDEFDGFGALTRRERLFAEAVFDGCSQREAARRAGVTGSDEVLDSIASRLARKPGVQRLLSQGWAKSGASISRTLAHAAELEVRAFRDAQAAETPERRREAFRQWRDAAALLASIHGRLGVRIEGTVTHQHSGAVAAITIPPDALAAFAQMRREVIEAQRGSQDIDASVIPTLTPRTTA